MSILLKKSINKNFTIAAAMAFSAGLVWLSGCGKQAFIVTATTQTQQAPGHFTVPPKVDILLAEDDTGSIFEIYTKIAKQMPVFLKGLEDRGWDYHFATTPLTTNRVMDQVVASKHDRNWGSQWVAPYPGAALPLPGMITQSLFRQFDRYTGFIGKSDISNSSNGQEPGFETIRQALYERALGTNLIRQDALLVIFVVGNGNDTSGVTMCTRQDGWVGPCEAAGSPQNGTMASSFNYYLSQFKALKTSQAQVSFHAAVANYRTDNCRGGRSYVGTRYKEMATALGGKSYDVCNASLTSILDSLAGSLQDTKIGFRTRYLFIDREPNPATIKVTRHAGGNMDVSSEITEDAENGWTYAGYVSNVHSIDYPAPMNLASGYAIELHGSARLIGDDTASVTFMPAGAENAAAK
ncbi:MAG: hypothetical protein AABZ06_05935 [Bdellovibrionota bacterium]